jgi:hypothetical protein
LSKGDYILSSFIMLSIGAGILALLIAAMLSSSIMKA